MTTTNVDADDPQPTLYWQLPEQHQARLQRALKVTDDEGYLAHDINWGRRLVDLADTDYRRDPTPDVDRTWQPPVSFERYSDTIAAVLQVAVEAGLDPTALCEAALATQRGVRAAATEAAHRRNA